MTILLIFFRRASIIIKNYLQKTKQLYRGKNTYKTPNSYKNMFKGKSIFVYIEILIFLLQNAIIPFIIYTIITGNSSLSSDQGYSFNNRPDNR